MNGADALITTLCDNGVEACFANPGTSEMQFVSALDREPRMRPVLCLFEGECESGEAEAPEGRKVHIVRDAQNRIVLTTSGPGG